jgi:hypothetical protein
MSTNATATAAITDCTEGQERMGAMCEGGAGVEMGGGKGGGDGDCQTE